MYRRVNNEKRKVPKVAIAPVENIGNERGVTLIEILVVIGILAIIAGFSYPNFKEWLPSYRLKRAARNLFSDMQNTRINAIRSQSNWAIVFDTSNNRYIICSSPGTDNNWTTLGDNTIEKTVNLSLYKSGIRYGHGNATSPYAGSFESDNVTFQNNMVIFTPRGILGSPTGYCYIENEKGATYVIGALTTGVIMLRKWYGSSWK